MATAYEELKEIINHRRALGQLLKCMGKAQSHHQLEWIVFSIMIIHLDMNPIKTKADLEKLFIIEEMFINPSQGKYSTIPGLTSITLSSETQLEITSLCKCLAGKSTSIPEKDEIISLSPRLIASSSLSNLNLISPKKLGSQTDITPQEQTASHETMSLRTCSAECFSTRHHYFANVSQASAEETIQSMKPTSQASTDSNALTEAQLQMVSTVTKRLKDILIMSDHHAFIRYSLENPLENPNSAPTTKKPIKTKRSLKDMNPNGAPTPRSFTKTPLEKTLQGLENAFAVKQLTLANFGLNDLDKPMITRNNKAAEKGCCLIM